MKSVADAQVDEIGVLDQRLIGAVFHPDGESEKIALRLVRLFNLMSDQGATRCADDGGSRVAVTFTNLMTETSLISTPVMRAITSCMAGT